MNISGKKINELDSIAPTLQTVLPAVYVNGTEVSETAGRISLQDIKSLIGGGGGGGGGGIQSISWYDNNVGTELTIMDMPDTTVVNVYKNGVLLREGADNDYTVAGNVITFSISLEAIDTICVIMGDPGMQLNLGDLSGAVVELSNIITAGKKQIANSLVNKGVTDIKYTDSLSKMADAIDALDTNGVGGVNPNFPLIFADRNMSTLHTNNSYQGFLPNGYMWQTVSRDYIDIYNMSTITLPTSATSPIQYGRAFRIDKDAVSTASGETLSTPFSIINIPNTNDFVAFAAGKLIKIVINFETSSIDSATAVNLVADEDSSVTSVTGSSYAILAADAETNTVLIWTNNDNGKIAYANISTGNFHSDNNSSIFWKGIGFLGHYHQPIHDYLLMFASSDCFMIKIDWQNIKESLTKYVKFNSNGSDSYYDSTTNKMYFITCYTSNRCDMIVYDFSVDTFSTRTISDSINDTGVWMNRVSSYSSHLLGTLYVLSIPNTTYRLFLTTSYSFVLDENDNIISYIDGLNMYCGLVKYDQTYGIENRYTFGKSYIYRHPDGSLYAIYFYKSYSYMTIYKLDLIYNKVLCQKVVKNGRTLVYGVTNTVLSEANLADGGPFDTNTTSLPVDI